VFAALNTVRTVSKSGLMTAIKTWLAIPAKYWSRPRLLASV
jgi:hypothetical protein